MGRFGRSFTQAFLPSFQQGQAMAARAIAQRSAADRQKAASDLAWKRQKEYFKMGQESRLGAEERRRDWEAERYKIERKDKRSDLTQRQQFQLDMASSQANVQLALQDRRIDATSERQREADARVWERQKKLFEMSEGSRLGAEERRRDWEIERYQIERKDKQADLVQRQQHQADMASFQANVQLEQQDRGIKARRKLEMDKLGIREESRWKLAKQEALLEQSKQPVITPLMDRTSRYLDFGPYKTELPAKLQGVVTEMMPFTSFLDQLYDKWKSGGTLDLGMEIGSKTGEQRPITFTTEPGKPFMENFHKLAAISKSRRYGGGEFIFGGSGAFGNVGKSGGVLNEILGKGAKFATAEQMVRNYITDRQVKAARAEPEKEPLPVEADRSAPTKSGPPPEAEAPLEDEVGRDWEYNLDHEVPPPAGYKAVKTRKELSSSDHFMTTPKMPTPTLGTYDWNQRLASYPYWGPLGNKLTEEKMDSLRTMIKRLRLDMFDADNPLSVTKKWANVASQTFPDILGPYFSGLTDKQLTSRIRYLLGDAKYSRTPFRNTVPRPPIDPNMIGSPMSPSRWGHVFDEGIRPRVDLPLPPLPPLKVLERKRRAL